MNDITLERIAELRARRVRRGRDIQLVEIFAGDYADLLDLAEAKLREDAQDRTRHPTLGNITQEPESGDYDRCEGCKLPVHLCECRGCPRCEDWSRMGLSDTCPTCDAIALGHDRAATKLSDENAELRKQAQSLGKDYDDMRHHYNNAAARIAELEAQLAEAQAPTTKKVIERLETERDKWRAEVYEVLPICDAQDMTISNLEAQLAEAVEVMQFYANVGSYYVDDGQKARGWLSKHTDEVGSGR